MALFERCLCVLPRSPLEKLKSRCIHLHGPDTEQKYEFFILESPVIQKRRTKQSNRGNTEEGSHGASPRETRMDGEGNRQEASKVGIVNVRGWNGDRRIVFFEFSISDCNIEAYCVPPANIVSPYQERPITVGVGGWAE